MVRAPGCLPGLWSGNGRVTYDCGKLHQTKLSRLLCHRIAQSSVPPFLTFSNMPDRYLKTSKSRFNVKGRRGEVPFNWLSG